MAQYSTFNRFVYADAVTKCCAAKYALFQYQVVTKTLKSLNHI